MVHTTQHTVYMVGLVQYGGYLQGDLRPEEGQSIWSKRRQSFQPCCKAGIRELPFLSQLRSPHFISTGAVCEFHCSRVSYVSPCMHSSVVSV